MIAAFLLAAAPLATAIDAERAFNAEAQRSGVWTAFRKYAAADAVMFTPQAVWAQNFLKGRKDPPKSFYWWPTASYGACDGRTAVNVGDAVKADGTPMSHFTTVWQKRGRDWRWVYDGGLPVGDDKLSAYNAEPKVIRASCRGRATGAPIAPPAPLTNKQARETPEDSGRGQSADRTLGWDWKVEKDGRRTLRVYLWNGNEYDLVLNQDVPA
jgi:hypothetical protein